MKYYRLTKNWSFGVEWGDSGCYWFFVIWCRTRHHKAKEYGPGEFRFYRRQWWKTYHDKKGKVTWEGTILERKGGW